VSYLLVVYYQNYKSYSAGMITCLTNRIGDRAILVAMGWMLSLGSLDFLFFVREIKLELVVRGAFIILAAMTKRAQIPFSAWLPAAIAAPTPVSALVHSSTLVTAGVFLLIRFFPCLIRRGIKRVLFFSGALTITMASLGALYEMDLKKIIALSTLRQLGLIIIALRINIYVLAFFHLLTHALFKASLFLAAGRVIHLFRGRQDVRRLRIVTSCIPMTSSLLVICSLSLGGAPFLSAFYSKDKIIEAVMEGGENFLRVVLLRISIMLTIMYRFRLVYYISMERFFLPEENNKDRSLMVKSIAVLYLGWIVGGRFIRWFVLDISYDNLFMFLKVRILYFFFIGGILGLSFKLGSYDFVRYYLGSI
jgi:NADH-ubiquinone oxidoreductase chain 5